MSRGTVNQVILIGNVGHDPEPRSTPSGTQIVNLNLATDDSYRDRQTGQMVPRTDWHRVVLIGKVAEVASQYVRKGQKLYVQGKQKTRKYQRTATSGPSRRSSSICKARWKCLVETMLAKLANRRRSHNSNLSRVTALNRSQQALVVDCLIMMMTYRSRLT